jgi:ABC-type multidrug transport system fused ATPase/permease subunit
MAKPMISPASDPENRTNDHTGWHRVNQRRLDLFVPAGSSLAPQADEVANYLDQRLSTLEDLLEPDMDIAPGKIEIHIIAPGDDHPESPDDMLVLASGADRAALVLPVVQRTIAQWYGTNATAATVIVTGIAALIANQPGPHSVARVANRRVHDALHAGERVSIFPFTQASGTAPGDETREAAATSFVSYVIDVFGAESLARFLATFNPDREDAAAQDVFYQPLGALEEAWLRDVQHHPEGGYAFRALFRHLLPRFLTHKWHVLELLVLTAGGVALTIAVPLTIMHIIDHILPHAEGEYGELIKYVGLLLVLFIVNAGVNARRNYVQHWVCQQVTIALRHRLFSHLQRLSHNYFSHTTTSNLMTIVNDDPREIESTLNMVLGNGLYLGLLAICTAGTVLVLDFVLGLLVLIVVPVFAIGYVMLRARWQREAHGFQRLQNEADHIAHENFSAHSEIKAFGLQERAIATYRQRHREMFGRQLRLSNLSGLFESTLHVASGFGYVIVFGVGGYQVIAERGGVTIGVLFAFAHLLPLFFEPIERLADLGHAVEDGATAFEHIDRVLAEPVMIGNRADAVELPPLTREVRFEHVTFGYGSGAPVLNDLSLTIPAGDDVAIIGPSGCGKSTVINLLLRFWDPDEGRVLIDGQDIRDVRIESLRRQMGLVFAETFIFDTSVRENIAIGHPDATDAEIEAAARAAQFDQFVRTLPAGYNTVLGERGVRMSSGQRQRLAIARALLRQPRVLLLDEATSSLDPRTESELLETLLTAGQSRTTVSVQHRLAAVATADTILVLDQGQLVEQGRHAELVKAGGLYQQLYEEQMNYLHGGGVLRVGVDVDRLRMIPLFAGFASEALAAIAGRFILERFAAGEVVVRQNEPGDKLYLISHGEAEVVAVRNGEERFLNRLGTGDYFGEMALLSNEPRNATVRTRVPTQFYSLTADDFQALLEQMPEVRDAVARTYEDRRNARQGLPEQ